MARCIQAAPQAMSSRQADEGYTCKVALPLRQLLPISTGLCSTLLLGPQSNARCLLTPAQLALQCSSLSIAEASWPVRAGWRTGGQTAPISGTLCVKLPGYRAPKSSSCPACFSAALASLGLLLRRTCTRLAAQLKPSSGGETKQLTVTRCRERSTRRTKLSDDFLVSSASQCHASMKSSPWTQTPSQLLPCRPCRSLGVLR